MGAWGSTVSVGSFGFVFQVLGFSVLGFKIFWCRFVGLLAWVCLGFRSHWGAAGLRSFESCLPCSDVPEAKLLNPHSGKCTMMALQGRFLLFSSEALREARTHEGVSQNKGPYYSTLNSRILIIRTPKQGTLNFRIRP